MPIGFDEAWLPAQDGRTAVKQIFRGGVVIGQVRRWQLAEDGSLIRERFTAERLVDNLYEPIEGIHPTFEEALERIEFYGVRP